MRSNDLKRILRRLGILSILLASLFILRSPSVTAVETCSSCAESYYTCYSGCNPNDPVCNSNCSQAYDLCSAGCTPDGGHSCSGCGTQLNYCGAACDSEYNSCYANCGGNTQCQNICHGDRNVCLGFCQAQLYDCLGEFCG